MNKRTASGEPRKFEKNDGSIAPIEILSLIFGWCHESIDSIWFRIPGLNPGLGRFPPIKAVCVHWRNIMRTTVTHLTIKFSPRLSIPGVQRMFATYPRVSALVVEDIGFSNVTHATQFACAINLLPKLTYLEIHPIVAGKHPFPFHLLEHVITLKFSLSRFVKPNPCKDWLEICHADESIVVHTTQGSRYRSATPPLRCSDSDDTDEDATGDGGGDDDSDVDDDSDDSSFESDSSSLYGLTMRQYVKLFHRTEDDSIFDLQYIMFCSRHADCKDHMKVINAADDIAGCYTMFDSREIANMRSLKCVQFEGGEISVVFLTAIEKYVRVENTETSVKACQTQ